MKKLKQAFENIVYGMTFPEHDKSEMIKHLLKAVEDYFKQSGKAGGQKTKQTQHPDYYREIGRIGGLKKKKRGEKEVK